MTVPAQSPEVSYAGNGTLRDFEVPFRYPAPADLRALVRAADGSEVELVNGVDFTATFGDSGSGGTLTTIAAPATGSTVLIWRSTLRIQEADYIESGAFKADSHETALDRAMMVAQEQDIAHGRAISVPRGETAPQLALRSTRASKFMMFDANGDVSVHTPAEFAALINPEMAVGLSLAFTELTGPRSQAVVFSPDGIGEGGYMVEFAAQSATDFVRAYAQVFAGDGTFDLYVLAGGSILWSSLGVSSSAADEAVSITLPQGLDLVFVIQNISGSVTGVVAKLEGAVE